MIACRSVLGVHNVPIQFEVVILTSSLLHHLEQCGGGNERR